MPVTPAGTIFARYNFCVTGLGRGSTKIHAIPWPPELRQAITFK